MLVEFLRVDGRWPKDALSNLAAVFCSRPGETATSPRFSALLGCKPCELVDCSPMHGTYLLAEQRASFVGPSAQQPAILTGIRRSFFGCLRADFQVAG